MAKSKAPLTPEQAEIKAMKKEKRSQGFIKFIAVLLALVLTVGVVYLGKTTADKAIGTAGPSVQSGDVNDGAGVDVGGDDFSGDMGGDVGSDVPSDDTNTPSDDTNAPSGDTNAPAGDTNAPAGNNAGTATFSKANAHEMFNKWTSAASKGSYKFTRVCGYTADGKINVGSATNILNGIIQGIDPNASLDTVVGGFLGIGNKGNEVKNGKLPEGMNDQYALKAMTLTAADVKEATASGNKYVIKLDNFSNPKKNGSNALSRATNDFFTHEEVVKGISELTTLIKVEATDVQYTNITLTAVVDNDKLKTLEISYGFSAKMTLKAVVTINGTGKATNKITYTVS